MTGYVRYGQFCPVAMAAEILCSRWTIPILREMLCGSTRFNELRKGVPRMSPALLAQRLRDLEDAGVVRRDQGAAGATEYRLTRAGDDLLDVVKSIGFWGQRWVDAEISLKNLDARLLMWDMRRNIKPNTFPRRRVVIQFLYPEQARKDRSWWLVIENGDVDLCSIDPGFDVDLYVSTDLRTMTQIWMGLLSLAQADEASRLVLTGDAELRRSIDSWLGLSIFAQEGKRPDANVGLKKIARPGQMEASSRIRA